MKRITALLLLVCLLLCGCSERIKEPVTFYYIQSNYEETMTSIIASEQREASGHREDLSYLMALYFMGPAAEDLRSPIPRGTNLVRAHRQDNTVVLHLTDTSSSMTDAQFTLACSCLTLTCLEITDAEYVTINSGERSVTMGEHSLLLKDLTTAAAPEETQ